MRLEIEPEFRLHWSRDVFGNSVATAEFLAPAERLRIRNDLLLRQTPSLPASPAETFPLAVYPMSYSPLEAVVAAAYQTTTYPQDVPAVRGWMQDVVASAHGRPAAELVAQVNRKVHDAIGYSRRETKGVQSPAETLSKGTGSCRDQATLLLEALRVLGFPTRFASGYLDCRASEAGRASTHAWAEAYLPERGWIGCDPTVGNDTSAKHVVVGVSNHPRGVMPITGGFFGEAADYLGMTVAVQTERSEAQPV
jgi:transglutaminase-like putative cysteine protease